MKHDLWWLLAAPVWAVLGTARHEFSHALIAVAQGAEIHEIRLFPVLDPNRGISSLLWGYISWSGGQTSWLAIAAPYITGLLLFGLFVLLCRLAPGMPRWLWVNGYVLCVISPLLDTEPFNRYDYESTFTQTARRNCRFF